MMAKPITSAIAKTFTTKARMTTSSARLCDAATIHATWRPASQRMLRAQAMYTARTAIARNSTVQRDTPRSRATTIPSITAIQSANRSRRSSSQRLARVECASITLTRSNVPRWRRQPGASADAHPTLCPGRVRAVQEEPVYRRARPGHVRAERSKLAQLVGERRRREVVRREVCKVPRTPDALERVEQHGRARLKIRLAAARIETRVHLGRRRLALLVRNDDQDPVILRQIELTQLRAVAGAELRARAQEERDIRTELARDRVEPVRRQRLGQKLIAECEHRCGVGTATAQAGGNRDSFVDVHGETSLVSRCQCIDCARDERVSLEARHFVALGTAHFESVCERDPLVDGEQLVFSVCAARSDDEGEVDLGGGGASLHRSASLSATNSFGASSSARAAGGRPAAG